MKNTLTADTSAQKNFSWPRPKGCKASGPGRPRNSPTLSSTWFATSATEWIISANSVGEPVTAQPKPLAAAIAVLVAMEIETEDDIASRYRRIRRVLLECHLHLPCGIIFGLIAAQLRLICVSFAYLPAAQDNPFPAGEPFESDRAAGVKLVGRDADLGAESVLE